MVVVVVCHGSVNRSPVAGFLLQKLRPDLEIRVRCVKPDGANRRPTLKARAAAERLELSFGEYKSRVLEPEDLFDADLVIYMDAGNRRRLIDYAEEWLPQGSSSAWFEHKTACLGNYVGEDRIRDPNFMKTGSEEEKAVFSLIERAVTVAAEQIKRG